MNYIVFDMEWNQPSSPAKLIKHPVKLHGEIIQIGAVRLNSEFCETGRILISIVPKYYTEINRYVKKLTGIDEHDLERGDSFPEAFESFMKWCGEDFCFITWGPDDMPTLRSNMQMFGIPTDILPKSYNLQLIFNKQKTEENRQWSLASAMEHLGLKLDEPAHNALNDAVFTARICGALDMEEGIASYEEPTPKPKRAPRPRYDSLKAHLITSLPSEKEKDGHMCPHCGTRLISNKRVRLRNRDKIQLCTCPDHGEFVVVMRRDSLYGEPVQYTVNYYPATDELMGFFHRMYNKARRP